MPKMGVDTACYDLARRYLTDAEIEQEQQLISLAEAIQQAIEDWFFSQTDRTLGQTWRGR